MNSKIIVPLIALVVCIGLIIFGVSFVFGQVGPLQDQINKLQADTQALSQKKSTLETVKSVVTAQADVTRLSLPSGNSTAPALAQIKRVAQEQGLIITSVNAVTTSSPSGEDVIRFEIKATGDYQQLYSFINRLKNILPLVNVDEVKAEDNGQGALTVSLVLNSFWSPLPETLPEITGTLDSLTEDEINILSRLSGFELPAFEELSPEIATDSGRIDPFTSQ